MLRKSISIVLLAATTACAASSGPDKTVGGAILGAAWGAGAGAVVGHQISYAGEGAAVGAGFGLVSGAASGLGYDTIEDSLLKQENDLDALRAQNAMNSDSLERIQARLDYDNTANSPAGIIQTVYFDTDATSLRTGSVSQLETLADSIKSNIHLHSVIITGHSDDSGSPDHNKSVAEARARSVTAFLSMKGIATDQIKVISEGSTKPVATNATPEGRQLNRRVEVIVK